jgi:peroxiredoxin
MQAVTVGSVAPAFELESIHGGRSRLAELRGKKVLVSFLRNAQCAVCNLWVHSTSKRAAEWRAQGLEVVAVFESSVEKLRTQFAEHIPPFEVLADPDGQAHDAYGSRVDAERVQAVAKSDAAKVALERAAAAGFPPKHEEGSNFFRLPCEVLLHEDGTVAAVHVAEGVIDHMDAETVAKFARGDA